MVRIILFLLIILNDAIIFYKVNAQYEKDGIKINIYGHEIAGISVSQPGSIEGPPARVHFDGNLQNIPGARHASSNVDWVEKTCYLNHVTKDSIEITFDSFHSSDDVDILAYELSFRELYNTQWTPIENRDNNNKMNEKLKQIIEIRVDQGKQITGGTFRLQLQWKGLLGEDPQDRYNSKTTRIPFAATADEMKQGLGKLENIVIEEVRRCDQFGSNMDEGWGGFEGWLFGCPYQARGGFKWLVIFNVTLSELSLPLLSPFRNELTPRDTWTGTGQQISITHISKGFISPFFCYEDKCKYTAKGLRPGTPYSFRVRALTALGWTDYGRISNFVSTLEEREPSRPRPPMLSSAGVTKITLQLNKPPSVQNVKVIESEYRQKGITSWSIGPKIALNVSAEYFKQTTTLTVENLEPYTTYEFRIRYINDVGPSIFSSSSDVCTTLADMNSEVAPIIPEIADDITAHSIDVIIKPKTSENTPYGKLTYKLQYKREDEMNWHSMRDPVVFIPRKQGVNIQEISTFMDYMGKSQVCTGYFWIKVGLVIATELYETVSPPIKIDASDDEMTHALSQIGVIKKYNPRITVRRRSNTNNGYTWNVEIQGIPNMGKFAVHKDTFVAITTFDKNDGPSGGPKVFVPKGTSLGRCYSANPVSTQILQQGEDVIKQDLIKVRINDLIAQRLYHIRTQFVDQYGTLGAISNAVSATTKATDEESYVDMSYILNGLPRDDWGGPRDDVSMRIGPPILSFGIGQIPAKQSDPHYMAGVGVGGLTGEKGANGYCVAMLYNPKKLAPFTTITFSFTGKPESLVIPESSPTYGSISLVTFKCWGAGGAGGKVTDLVSTTNYEISLGGGAAFAQVTVNIKEGDVFEVNVGGGGETQMGEKGGIGGYNGGGNGGNGILGGAGGY